MGVWVQVCMQGGLRCERRYFWEHSYGCSPLLPLRNHNNQPWFIGFNSIILLKQAYWYGDALHISIDNSNLQPPNFWEHTALPCPLVLASDFILHCSYDLTQGSTCWFFPWLWSWDVVSMAMLRCWVIFPRQPSVCSQMMIAYTAREYMPLSLAQSSGFPF